MEIWQALQEELNRLYEMFVQRNPYFETNGGKVSIGMSNFYFKILSLSTMDSNPTPLFASL